MKRVALLICCLLALPVLAGAPVNCDDAHTKQLHEWCDHYKWSLSSDVTETDTCLVNGDQFEYACAYVAPERPNPDWREPHPPCFPGSGGCGWYAGTTWIRRDDGKYALKISWSSSR